MFQLCSLAAIGLGLGVECAVDRDNLWCLANTSDFKTWSSSISMSWSKTIKHQHIPTLFEFIQQQLNKQRDPKYSRQNKWLLFFSFCLLYFWWSIQTDKLISHDVFQRETVAVEIDKVFCEREIERVGHQNFAFYTKLDWHHIRKPPCSIL